MKARLIAATLLTVLTLSAAPTIASAQTHFDINLEGPWILYVDTRLASDHHPLLIAISAGGVSKKSDETYFHFISVSAGDGYQVKRAGIYCLTFLSVCGGTGESSALDPDSYPQPNLLPLANPSGWDWIDKSDSTYSAIGFILPMPKHYSADGTWSMRFATAYDNTGQSYGKPMEYSTGVQLHYENGPASFDLLDCTPPNVFPSNCPSASNIVGNSKLNNTGTLTIAMKSPDSDNACDPHVRRAHPKTLGLLDDDNDNKGYKAIDTAIGKDAKGDWVFDKWDSVNSKPMPNVWCLDDWDPQKPGSTMSMAYADHLKPSWDSQLDALTDFIKTALSPDNSHRTDPRLTDKGLLLPEITKAAGQLDRYFPRFSRYRLVEALVRGSVERGQELIQQARNSPQGREDGKVEGDNRLVLPNLLALGEAFLNAPPPTKNGNDCKAAIILTKDRTAK